MHTAVKNANEIAPWRWRTAVRHYGQGAPWGMLDEGAIPGAGISTPVDAGIGVQVNERQPASPSLLRKRGIHNSLKVVGLHTKN
jgi:hypothetical protein